ncbi:hypothetical protein BIT28_01050 [Photobacterium proteolyticum]|uniref:Uncharacterized protein n=1 Tax=Photobacterium proteolyticum TaxID=1903952 RepID=A0A1Q9GXD1_9GAMM|nr:hypothetical protein BIT28_01050 [Photobacterium proteolyticum]
MDPWIITIAESNWSGEIIEGESYRRDENSIFDADQEKLVRQDHIALLCLPSHMKLFTLTEK